MKHSTRYAEQADIAVVALKALNLPAGSPTDKADKVIGAVDGNIASLDASGNLTDSGIGVDDLARAVLLQGSYDASTGLYPVTGGSGIAGAVMQGDLWRINTAGNIGGTELSVGDYILALEQNPAQTQSNWGIIQGKLLYTPAVSRPFDPTNIYVNLVDGDDANAGTPDAPVETFERAFALASTTLGATLHVITNPSVEITGLQIPNVAPSLTIKGYCTSEFGGLDSLKYLKFVDLNVSATTGTICIVNASITNFSCSTSVRLVNTELKGNIAHTANDSLITYQATEYGEATHSFIYNGLKKLNFSEYPDAFGEVVKLPLVLEDVITVRLVPPILSAVTLGDRYLIINGTPTGDWASHLNKIATWRGTVWDYQPLVNGNIVTTQDNPPVTYLYNGTTWSEIAKPRIGTRIADAISEGLMSSNQAEELVFVTSVLDIEFSANELDRRLVRNPTTGYYEYFMPPKYVSVQIIPEVVLPAMTGVANTYPTAGLVPGNIVIYLPNLQANPEKPSVEYDSNKYEIKLAPNTIANRLVIKSQAGVSFQTRRGATIDGNIGYTIAANVTTRLKWEDPNPDPNYPTKPIQWTIID